MNLRVLNQKYTCGGCTVCCEVVAVQELAKPFHARCEHARPTDCAIYEDRPQSCREFVCSWAAGLMGEGTQWRPDRNGLLFFLRRYADGLWLEIYEAAKGAAADEKRVGYLAGRIAERVAKHEKIIGTRLYRHADKIGLGFVADDRKYPSGIGTSMKWNRFDWINGDASRQVFRDCHDSEANV